MTDKLQKNTLAPGKKIVLQIKKLGINGEGIAYYKKTIVFIPDVLPTEEVLAEITSISKNFMTARLVKIKKPSVHRVTPRCSVYKECGGCQLQHLSYDEQLSFKQDLVKQSLKKFQPKGYTYFTVLPTIGMENPWFYRNKLQFQVRQTDENQVISGLYQTDSHQLISIENCPVQFPQTTAIIQAITRWLQELAIPIYNERKNSGILKTVMIRIGAETEEIQVVFITNSKKLPKKRELIEQLATTFPQIVSIMQNVQDKKTSLVMGDETFLLWGKQTIEERLDNLTFDLSARAFFQLNPIQTRLLYSEVKKALNPKPTDTIIDAYCGVGIIGLSMAQEVAEIRGMDIIPAAIEDAQENAQRIGAEHTFYETGTAESLIPKWIKEGFQADGLIVDPPRTGLDPKLLQTLLDYPIPKIVYVSCNPSTLAQNLVELSKKYHVEYLQPIDMFPQTAKCEIVVSLRLKKNQKKIPR